MRTKPGERIRNQAFSRLELVCCIGGVILLAGMSFPSFANTRARSERAICVDNLRRIGQAVQLWGAEHDQRTPWNTPVAEGGTLASSKVGSAFREFLFLSNYLVTPKILACPSDVVKTRRSAADWSNSAESGYANAVNMGNNVTSYPIGLHSFLAEPDSHLSGDRNLQVDNTGPLSCSAGVNNASGITRFPSSVLSWTNAIHGLTGNLLLADGRVLLASTPQLREVLLQRRLNDNGVDHLLIP